MAKVVFSSYYLIIPDFFFKDNKIRQMVGLLGEGVAEEPKKQSSYCKTKTYS